MGINPGNSSNKKTFTISPIVITEKKDQSIKLALDSKVLNEAIHKNKYQMPNIEMLTDSISQHLTNTQNGLQAYFSTSDLKCAYSQLQLHKDTAQHCNFKIVVGNQLVLIDLNGILRFTDMPAEFQKSYGLYTCLHKFILQVFITPIISLMT